MTSNRAEVLLEKFEVYNRRLVAGTGKITGQDTVGVHPLEMGSYRLRIRKEGF